MARPVVYHNPGCGTSRRLLEELRARDADVEVVEYLKTPLTKTQLTALVRELPTPPAELVRKDKRFGELGLDADDYTTQSTVVALLVEHPELMQRPVVRVDGRSVISRPPELGLELLGLA